MTIVCNCSDEEINYSRKYLIYSDIRYIVNKRLAYVNV